MRLCKGIREIVEHSDWNDVLSLISPFCSATIVTGAT